ncbi:unnamed protein product [Schistosoma turkestanicum]|nr:unnamed protein product [Schistosoma turkestanicum]
MLYHLSVFNIQYIQCTTTVNDLLIYPNRHKKLFKIIHYLIRQCAPYCLNYGRLEKPDMPWKKCYCICPDGYYGVACEFNRIHEEIDIDQNSNNNNNNHEDLTSDLHNFKSNTLPISHRRASTSSFVTAHSINNNQETDDRQLIFVK